MAGSRRSALEAKQARRGEFTSGKGARSITGGGEVVVTAQNGMLRRAVLVKAAGEAGVIEVDAATLNRVLNEQRAIQVLGTAIAANPEQTSPELARSLQAEENWWRRIEKELPSLSSTETASLLGASASNRNFASAQRAAGKLIGYSRRHAFRYPEFQFDTSRGTVLPVIPRLLAVTRGLHVPDEDLVLWMAARSSAFADQRRPVDHLNDPERLLAAAEAHFGASW